MKKILLPVLGALSLLAAHADMTITQEMHQDTTLMAPGSDLTVTMKIKGDKVRMDGMPQMSTIVDLKSGDVTSLMHSQKVVMKIPGSTIKSIQEMQTARSGAASAADPLKATGRKETINGYECEEYETDVGGAKVDLWLTKNLPAAERAMAQAAQLAGDNDPLKSILKDQKVPGFPMRTVIDNGSQGKITITVTSLNEDPIPDSAFETPSDYRLMQTPTLPGMTGH